MNTINENVLVQIESIIRFKDELALTDEIEHGEAMRLVSMLLSLDQTELDVIRRALVVSVERKVA